MVFRWWLPREAEAEGEADATVREEPGEPEASTEVQLLVALSVAMHLQTVHKMALAA